MNAAAKLALIRSTQSNIDRALPDLYPDCGEQWMEADHIGQWFRCDEERTPR